MTPPIDKITITIPAFSRSKTLGYADVRLAGHLLIRSYRVIAGERGGCEVRVPDRALSRRCPHCEQPCACSYHYCPDCGEHIGQDAVSRTARGRAKWTTSVVYSTDPAWTEVLTKLILDAFAAGLKRAPVMVTSFDVVGGELVPSSMSVGNTIPRPAAAG